MGTHDERTRSGLAYAFLDLVERHRPPIILLENVPGLLSSNGGADLLALTGRLVELGYGWAFRIFDAQFQRVPQRRRRVFICALRCGDDDPDGRVAAERASAVLAVGSRCGRDHQAEREERAQSSGGTWRRPDIVGQAVNAKWAKRSSGPAGDEYHHLVVDGPPPDADGMRATDGLGRRLDGGAGVAATLNSGGNNGGFRTEPGEHLVAAYVKTVKLSEEEHWERRPVTSTLSLFDSSEVRSQTLVHGPAADSDLDPIGLDSHRYRCAGNGVVAPVAEWIGVRLRRYVEGTL